MIILGCNGISLSFGTTRILENTTFSVQDSEKIGIVGVNGAGKSTLFKILSGALQPDKGEVFISKGKKIGYLEQNSGLDIQNSIWDELLSCFSSLIELEARIKVLEEKISVEKNDDTLSSLMKEYATSSDKFAQSNGYEYNSRVKGVLKGLGFNEDQFTLKVKSLSGGQKTRLALAKLLLEEPDILFLDEPTNHLDIEAIEWLESFLKGYPKSVLLISHDRYFLDAVTNVTIELENCECTVYSGNYTQYIKQKALNQELQQRHFDNQQKEIAKMEAFIEQQKRWNREKNIIAAESRQKAIDRIQRIDKPSAAPDKIKIKMRTTINSGNDVLFVEGLSKEYPGKPLFKDVNFHIRKSENVFLLGPNGCGKSTLLKILVAKLAQTSGNFEYGHNIKVGYYDQEQEDIDENNIVLDEVWDSNEKLTQTQIRTTLASFLFSGEDVFKPISVLSGGEKSRVALVKLMLSDSNLLILDEPTNHLDINSREVLEASLKDFNGTILAVSHDRYFINKLSTRILELNSDALIDYKGDYSQFLEYKAKIKKESKFSNVEVKASAAKIERIATKEEKAKQRKTEKQLLETEQEINKSEKRLEDIDVEMTYEAVYSDHVKLTQLHEEQSLLKSRLEELYELWGALSEES
jgi:ATP-binding cassette, subfamily F, member 3